MQNNKKIAALFKNIASKVFKSEWVADSSTLTCITN